MKILITFLCMATLIAGCAGQGTAEYAANEPAEPQPVLIQVEAPEPIEVPARREVASDTDWEAKVHNKEIEIIEVLNVINPIAVYITKGFEQHGSKFSETLDEEWEDTQAQLTTALTLYEDCKKRKAAGQFDKQLFLDLEQAWQMLVKTGVAGVRTKSMVDNELRRAIG
jgi:hypothetical protein